MDKQSPDEIGKKQLHIGSLGSSFAAGPGIPPTINHLAMRSGNNYPHLLAKRLGARLTDLSVSGATLKQILCESYGSFKWTRFEPQLKALPADVDIVTITGGGNDIGYIGGVFNDALNAKLGGYLPAQILSIPASNGRSAEDVADSFIAIIDKIWKIAPRARIFLVEYLTLFGPDVRPEKDVPLSQEQISHHRNVAGELSKAYGLAKVARPDVTLLPVGEQSLGHGIGSEEPWVQGLNLSSAFHPNLKGMEAVADMIYDELNG